MLAARPNSSCYERSKGILDAQQTPDAESDSGVCVNEPFPLFDFAPARVPLSVLCGDRCLTLAERNDQLECFAIDEDAGLDSFDDDAGINSGLFRWWTRSTGCGSVQIATIHPSWPRIYNYDPDTGELIGAAQLDDVGTELGNYPCVDAAYIAGEVRASCEGEQIEVCSWSRN